MRDNPDIYKLTEDIVNVLNGQTNGMSDSGMVEAAAWADD